MGGKDSGLKDCLSEFLVRTPSSSSMMQCGGG